VPFVNWANHYRQRQWNLVGSSSYSAGKHTARFGADFRTLAPDVRTLPYLLSVSPPGGASPEMGLDALLAGGFTTMVVTPSTPAAFRVHNLSLFAEDTWRLSSQLTLSGGFRYESNPPPVAANREPLFASTPLGDGPADVTVSADGHNLWKNGYNHFAPRVSAALRPSPHRGLVLRGAVGMFYDLGFGPALESSSVAGPTTLIFNLQVPSGPPQYIVQSGAPGEPACLLVSGFRTPFTVRWNATVEQPFGNHGLMSLSYVGATGYDLLLGEYLNNRQVITNQGYSRYDALHAQVRARLLSSRLQGLASFAWGHSIDNVSNDSVPISANVAEIPIAAQDSNRGNSDFDVRLSSYLAFAYDVPHLRGWLLDGIFRARTGFPFSALASAPAVRASLAPDQPLWIADSGVATGRRLNPAAFSAPPQGAQGNTGRNSFAGPGMWQLDVALQRQFRVSERLALQFRMEAFNLTNHPNFANPDNVLTLRSFGYPASMLNQYLGSGGPASGLAPALQIGGPRALQAGFRLRF
jgi:hypothetical protein